MSTLHIVIIATLLVAIIAIGSAFALSDDSGLFRRFLFVLGALFAMFLAGIVCIALSGVLVMWLGLDEKAAMFAQLGCFILVLVAIGWTYDKLRDWRASRD